jgi:hypothetical protein
MEDDDGKLSFYLLAGARYRKDTRLLPRGWSLDHPEAKATMPQGVSVGKDFSGDGARVVYEFALPDEGGPFTFDAEVYYQTIGTRYLNEVLKHRRLPEVARLERLLKAETVDRRPVLVDAMQMRTPN